MLTSTSMSHSNGNSTRLGKCEVCYIMNAVYVCPKCELKTCSVKCVKIHKAALNCNGIRDRTKFIRLRDMTSRDFMNDYYFLEECTHYTENRKCDKLKHYTHRQKLPTHLLRLRYAAEQRGTCLKYLLKNFTRHKLNTTYYNWHHHILYWRIEWVFINAITTDNADELRLVDKCCNEEHTLAALLSKYVDPRDERSEQHINALCYYQSAGLPNIKVLLRAEQVKCSEKCYYELDMCMTLRENLVNKTIIEYPIIYVTYDQQLDGFQIIHSDDANEGPPQAQCPETKHLTQRKLFNKTNALPKAKQMKLNNAVKNEQTEDTDLELSSDGDELNIHNNLPQAKINYLDLE